MKNQKGITLVALIITIIVMLILVAVSVAVVINSNLLGAADQATEKYKNEANKEKNLGEGDLVEEKNGTKHDLNYYVNKANLTE